MSLEFCKLIQSFNAAAGLKKRCWDANIVAVQSSISIVGLKCKIPGNNDRQTDRSPTNRSTDTRETTLTKIPGDPARCCRCDGTVERPRM